MNEFEIDIRPGTQAVWRGSRNLAHITMASSGVNIGLLARNSTEYASCNQEYIKNKCATPFAKKCPFSRRIFGVFAVLVHCNNYMQ